MVWRNFSQIQVPLKTMLIVCRRSLDTYLFYQISVDKHVARIDSCHENFRKVNFDPRLLLTIAEHRRLRNLKNRSFHRHSFNERVDHLLAMSPSEYVRKDKERKNREAGLRTCLQSLTTLLERALNGDATDLESLSKEAIRKSINAIKENFESHMSK